MAGLDEFDAFKNFLNAAKDKCGKSFTVIREELGEKPQVWHDGEKLPNEKKLPLIAQAYCADLEGLTAAFNRSKAAHDIARSIRRQPRGRK